MRITQALIANISRQSAGRASKALFEANRPVMEGTSLSAPSQDLGKADRVAALDRFQRDLERLGQSRATVRADLVSAEDALGGIHDVVADAHTLALQMSSDTVSPVDRRNAASTAQRLLDQIAAYANQQEAGGKFLFAGTAEMAPPLDPNFSYQGNDGVRMVEVGPGLMLPATMCGRDVFGPNDEVIAALTALVDALKSGDSGKVAQTLDGLEAGRQRVSAARTEIGGRIATLDDIDATTSSLMTSLELEKADLTGVDLAEVVPAITNAQTMLQAAIATSQRIMSVVGQGWLS